MATFKYKALDPTNGMPISGQVEADTLNAAHEHLAHRRLQQIKVSRDWKNIEIVPARVTERDLVDFTRQMAAMADAGLPLIQSLQIMLEQSDSPALRRVIRQVVIDVESGEPLSHALRRNPKTFSPLYVALVRAGEASSMDTALNRLADLMEKSREVSQKVKGALYYPIGLIVIAVGALLTTYFKVFPAFEDMFNDMPNLPALTRFNLDASQWCRENPLLLTGGLVGIVLFLYVLFTTPATRKVFDRWGLKIPIVGALVQKAAVARFARTLATLNSAGVHMIEALELTAETAGNTTIRAAIELTQRSVGTGGTLGGTLRHTGVFPPIVTSMISVGEDTGKLTEMLDKIADNYEKEAMRQTDIALEALKPILLILMGVMVSFLVGSIYAPIFDSLAVSAEM